MIEEPFVPADRSPAVDAAATAAKVRSLCEHHAAALLTIASVLLDDVDVACEIVAETLASACREAQVVRLAGPETRSHLARSIYHRCLGRIASKERFPQLYEWDRGPKTASLPLSHLSVDQRAVLSLTLFGRHGVTQAAATVRAAGPRLQQAGW